MVPNIIHARNLLPCVLWPLKGATLSSIQVIDIRVFVPKFLPFYHLAIFSDGNARDRTSFGRRPEALPQ